MADQLQRFKKGDRVYRDSNLTEYGVVTEATRTYLQVKWPLNRMAIYTTECENLLTELNIVAAAWAT